MLAGLGFPRRDDAGAAFDPARHEAVAARARSPASRRGRWSRSCGPATATASASCGRRGRGGQGGLMAAPDFYEILGVPRTASRTRSSGPTASWPARYHPDVNKDPGAEERFKEISEAYDVLSDPETRRRYDAFGPDFRQVPGDVDPDAWARAPGQAPERAAPGGRRRADRAAAGGFRPAATSTSRTCSAACSAAGPGAGAAGRGGRGGRGWGPIPGADQEAELQLTVEEAYRGGRRTVTLQRPGRAAHARRHHPGRGHRRAADPAGRPGRPGRRRRAGPETCTWSCPSRPHPRYRAAGPRPLRRAAARAVGGGARRVGRRSTRPAARPR